MAWLSVKTVNNIIRLGFVGVFLSTVIINARKPLTDLPEAVLYTSERFGFYVTLGGLLTVMGFVLAMLTVVIGLVLKVWLEWRESEYRIEQKAK